MPVAFEARFGIGSGVLGAGGALGCSTNPAEWTREGDAAAQRREDRARARYTAAMVTLIVSAAILTVTSAVMLLVPSTVQGTASHGWLIRAAALLGLLFFGYCLLLLVRLAVRSAVEVRLDASGLYDRSWSDRPIPWTEIVGGHEEQVAGRDVLCLQLRQAGTDGSKGA